MEQQLCLPESVTTLIVNHHQIEAKIQGSRPKPYTNRIIVPEFIPQQPEILTNLLAKDPAWPASLLNRQLLPALLNLALKWGINIFPTQWSDLEMSCSCSDFAAPCKHLAAMVYELANQTDLNPMLVLQLDCYNANAALQSRQVDITNSRTEPIENLLTQLKAYQPQRVSLNEEIFTQIDRAPIPFIGEISLNLLSAATPFTQPILNLV